MKKSTEIAADLYEKKGALLSVIDVMDYCHCSRNTAKALLGPMAAKKGKSKQYFYMDVAERIAARVAQ
ncbi:MAG: hypothetical protein ACOX8R_02470 [Bacillota bacterium]|jgi:hypothetical protein